jgi:hypothetical protein
LTTGSCATVRTPVIGGRFTAYCTSVADSIRLRLTE